MSPLFKRPGFLCSKSSRREPSTRPRARFRRGVGRHTTNIGTGFARRTIIPLIEPRSRDLAAR